jgi:hypothetical protein
MLINSLLSHTTETYWVEFTSEIERLNVPKAVERLMSSHTIEDLTSSILDFQANMVRVVYRRKTTPVDPENDEVQGVLNIRSGARPKWTKRPSRRTAVPRVDPLMSPRLNGHAKVPSELEGRWWKLGFGSDDLRAEFKTGGMLALDCLVCHLLFCLPGMEWSRHLGRNNSSLPIQKSLLSGYWSRIVGRWRGDVPLARPPTRSLRSCRSIGRSLHLGVSISLLRLTGSLLKARRRFDLKYLPTILPQLLQSPQPRHCSSSSVCGATAVPLAPISTGLPRWWLASTFERTSVWVSFGG